MAAHHLHNCASVPVQADKVCVRPGSSPGAMLRKAIHIALTRRQFLQATGRSQVDCRISAMRLTTWLERNPTPSLYTVATFPLLGELQVVMPARGDGPKMLQQAIEAINLSKRS
jgi:hypothetical protein